VASSASQFLVVAGVVEDSVEDTEETFGVGVAGGVLGLQETDRLPVRADDATQLEDKFENVRQRDEIDEKLGFIASPMAQNERAGWSTCIQSVTRRLRSLTLLKRTLH
jgi:hypothetical protein